VVRGAVARTWGSARPNPPLPERRGGTAGRSQRVARAQWSGPDHRRHAAARHPGRDRSRCGNAAQAGILAGPPVASLPITEPQAEAARAAFALSCPGLMRRTDASGLTQGADWQPACQAAASVPRGQLRDFFARYFEAVQVGDGRSLATGYYEPEIAGSRERRAGYECRSMPGRAI
jgi:membrane-bound lytic murein transglycosylase A